MSSQSENGFGTVFHQYWWLRHDPGTLYIETQAAKNMVWIHESKWSETGFDFRDWSSHERKSLHLVHLENHSVSHHLTPRRCTKKVNTTARTSPGKASVLKDSINSVRKHDGTYEVKMNCAGFDNVDGMTWELISIISDYFPEISEVYLYTTGIWNWNRETIGLYI